MGNMGRHPWGHSRQLRKPHAPLIGLCPPAHTHLTVRGFRGATHFLQKIEILLLNFDKSILHINEA